LTSTLTSLTLPNGLILVAERLQHVQSAAFQFLIPAGAVTDPEGGEGAAGVLEGLSFRGAGERDTRALSDALDLLGLHRSGGAELECTAFGGVLLARDLPRALALYADLLRRPHLPAEGLPAEQALAYQRLDRLEDSPGEKLIIELRRTYFPGAYGRTALGIREHIAALTPAALRADHARRYRPRGSILAVAGQFAWSELCDTVHALFGDWEGAAPELPAPVPRSEPAYRHVPQQTNQEQIGVMYPTAALGSPDYYAMRLAVEVLSGGMGARLFTEVREKRGLCYSVSARPLTLRGAGAILAYAGTTPERCNETLAVLLAELRRLGEGVSDEELARARTGVLSALVMQGEATRARAQSIARDQFLLGRPRSMEEIRRGLEAVTPQDISAHLARYPARNFTVTTLGPVELQVPE
jgi:predicted Zn-dependent peptidase